MGDGLLLTETTDDLLQLPESVIVTVYVAGASAEAVGPVCPLLQTKLNVPVPPVAITLALPFDNPQAAATGVILAVMAAGSVIVTVLMIWQLLASVTVTVKIPLVSPPAVCVTEPLLQVYV